MLVKAQHSVFFYANRSVIVEGEFCHLIFLSVFKSAIAILWTVTTVWHQLNKGSLGGDEASGDGAPDPNQNQGAGPAVVPMAQPWGPPICSLVLLPLWKLHSRVPCALWALSLFWNAEHMCTRNLLSQLCSQTVSEVEDQNKPFLLLLL